MVSNTLLQWVVGALGLVLAVYWAWLWWTKQGTRRHMTSGQQPACEMWVGPPGNGKSLYAATRIEEMLLYDKRKIVTSLKIRLHGWDNYMQRVHGFTEVRNRLFYMPVEDRRAFMENRGDRKLKFTVIRTEADGYQRYGFLDPATGQPILPEDEGNVKLPGGGIIYILDEVHKDFRARDTGTTPKRLLDYLSEVRQYSDRVIAITQHPENVDVCFTRIGDRFCQFTNLGKRRKLGVSFGRGFMRSDYADVTCTPASSEGFVVTGFNEKIAELYETAAAGGGEADKGERVARFVTVPNLLIAALLIGTVAAFKGPRALVARYLGGGTRVAVPGAPTGPAPVVQSVGGGPAADPVPVVGVVPRPSPAPPAPAPAQVVFIDSWASVSPNVYVVRLSDGSRFRVQARETLNGLLLPDGITLPMPYRPGPVPRVEVQRPAVPVKSLLERHLLGMQ